ncbi:hypothetical protein M0805_006916 [Coniferiporia weirii]|nr:hypothetical protein M0805_006916 [Coniferiporia weirii]
MQDHGGYSDIFTGYCSTLPSNGKVAIKRLRMHIAGDKKFHKKLMKELHIWAKLDHPYILPFLGFFFESNDYPSLVSMWMDNGTILTYLDSHPECDLRVIVLRIAEGIEYLHTANVVHSDIKPDNILISSSGEPRICDFGISRMLVESKSLSFGDSTTGDLKGTIRYMSIELLRATDVEPHTYSKASDIWAFGMTLLVFLTRKPPYYHIKSDFRVVPIIMSGELPPVPEDFQSWSEPYKNLWQMCTSCWDKAPRKRPSMSAMASDLRRPLWPWRQKLNQDPFVPIPSDTTNGLYPRPIRILEPLDMFLPFQIPDALKNSPMLHMYKASHG